MSENLSILTRKANPPDLTLTYGDSADQVADVRYGRCGSELPLVVLIHGGFWKPEYDRAHAECMSCALAEAGWTTLTLEYRRISGQPDVSLEDITTSLKALPMQVASHNGKVVLVGHSAGGHLALWAAAQVDFADLKGVLALAPAADLQMAHALGLGEGAVLRFLGVDPGLRSDVDPLRLKAPAVPISIVQGEDDEIVPVAVSKAYCLAFPETRWVSLPECGHFAVIDPLTSAWNEVTGELRRLSC